MPPRPRPFRRSARSARHPATNASSAAAARRSTSFSRFTEFPSLRRAPGSGARQRHARARSRARLVRRRAFPGLEVVGLRVEICALRLEKDEQRRPPFRVGAGGGVERARQLGAELRRVVGEPSRAAASCWALVRTSRAISSWSLIELGRCPALLRLGGGDLALLLVPER